MTKSSCCTPARGTAVISNCGPKEVSTGTRPHIDSVLIPGGTGLVGTAAAQIDGDGESPLRRVRIKPFRMSVTTVTNAQFATFVSETGYVTEAEKFGWSFVFWSQVPEALTETQAVAHAQWWRRVDGAIWSAPNGPGSEGDCHPDHPVVQVSWNDACAFARWVGGACRQKRNGNTQPGAGKVMSNILGATRNLMTLYIRPAISGRGSSLNTIPDKMATSPRPLPAPSNRMPTDSTISLEMSGNGHLKPTASSLLKSRSNSVWQA